MDFQRVTSTTRTCEVNNAKIYEYEPGYRTISIGGQKFRLFFPYSCFIFQQGCDVSASFNRGVENLRVMKLGFRTTPLVDLNSSLKFSPLSNQYSEDWAICSRPNLQFYWNSDFDTYGGWPGVGLAGKMFAERAYDSLYAWKTWAGFSPEEVMRNFEYYPKSYEKYHVLPLEEILAFKIAPLHINHFNNIPQE